MSRLATVASGCPARTSCPLTTKMRVMTPGYCAATATRALGWGRICAGNSATGIVVDAAAGVKDRPIARIWSLDSAITPSRPAAGAAGVSDGDGAAGPEAPAIHHHAPPASASAATPPIVQARFVMNTALRRNPDITLTRGPPENEARSHAFPGWPTDARHARA